MSVVPFPTVPNNDMAAKAREFADAYEAGEIRHSRAILIIEGAGIEMFLWGEELNQFAAIGILECARQHVVNQIIS